MAPTARLRASDSFPPLEVTVLGHPRNPARRWIRGREYQDLVLTQGESAEAQMPQPNCFFAVSDIISGVHGGSPTMSTFASLIPGNCSSFPFSSWRMYPDARQPRSVTVILASTLPSSPFC